MALLEHIEEHFHYLLGHKRHRPGEYIHEVRQYVRVRSVVELLDVESVLFELDYGALVVVHVAVIWSREDGDHHWELRGPVPLMHLVPIELSLVSSQDREQLVFMEELVGGLLAEEVRTASHVVLLKPLRTAALFIFHWI